ncbi:MAG: alginate export family protein [Polyangiaceae bacterium]
MLGRKALGVGSLTALASLTLAGSALADEPWSDPDPAEPPMRIPIGDFGITGGAEYRAQLTYINPISLNSISQRRVSWIEHRLRLDAAIDYDEKVKIVSSFDILDGVLWGDNGGPLDDPKTNAGTTVNTKNPNNAVPCIGYRGPAGGDALSSDNYGYALCESQIFKVRRLYGDIVTPIGLLRIGRQPFSLGNTLQGVPGDGRFNRFGIAREGNFVDRITFGTKPLEALKPAEQRNLSLDEGLFIVAVYDHLVSDDLRLFSDDEHQAGGALFFKAKEYPIGQDLEVMGYFVQRWSDEFSTNVSIFGGRAMSRFGPVYVGLEGAANLGKTREVAAAYKAITNDPVVDQNIVQVGARAVVRVDYRVQRAHDERKPGVSGYLEVDFASGDGDPQARTDLSQFTWAPDMNVGLLMFEHALRFQSARAAAAAVETLARLGSVSYPVDAIDTRGAFTDALAIFPQIDFRPHEDVLIRAGVLIAWAPEPVVDPVGSLLARDGVSIEDDLVNYAGGKPGQFYGTELDLRAQWRFLNHFTADLEGAILFPGDALQDENGDAARSILLQGRTSFFF